MIIVLNSIPGAELMKNRTKPYSLEFRKLIVDQYNSGQSVKKLSNQFDISQVSIYRWIKKSNIENKNDINPTITADHHLLQKYVSDLKKENEILRKVIKILSKDS